MNAIRLYKFSNYLFKKKLFKAALVIQSVNRILNNSHIPYSVKIGENSKFAYGGIGVVIHSKAIIGNNCMIGQNTTIGGRTGHGVAPIIGDNVYIAAGSRVLGGINIGSNVVIGANAVVVKDVPSNSVVVGIPATIISRDVEKFKKAGII
ncbi:serine acetyltransferase [Propionigenium maris DSM 9537]|uniref:Serine acetyltransferase n=1 Tax=Propionigenium maris DSM 9537 TaxID=1123000 RepID=A0A9W6GNA6_9FUSO|nr:DapH/DapD/GlmU-related protein [Propionigenium maris]GLI56921.1 serine acetyltransferase [Propionigenium maris DSM 9537]